MRPWSSDLGKQNATFATLSFSHLLIAAPIGFLRFLLMLISTGEMENDGLPLRELTGRSWGVSWLVVGQF